MLWHLLKCHFGCPCVLVTDAVIAVAAWMCYQRWTRGMMAVVQTTAGCCSVCADVRFVTPVQTVGSAASVGVFPPKLTVLYCRDLCMYCLGGLCKIRECECVLCRQPLLLHERSLAPRSAAMQAVSLFCQLHLCSPVDRNDKGAVLHLAFTCRTCWGVLQKTPVCLL